MENGSHSKSTGTQVTEKGVYDTHPEATCREVKCFEDVKQCVTMHILHRHSKGNERKNRKCKCLLQFSTRLVQYSFQITLLLYCSNEKGICLKSLANYCKQKQLNATAIILTLLHDYFREIQSKFEIAQPCHSCLKD